MPDRLLARAWWTATMVLILLCAIGSLMAAYQGVFAVFAKSYSDGITYLLLCGPIGAAAYFLCKHRGDLVCD